MVANPYIRDVVKVGTRLQEFCQKAGAGPIFLLGRRVEHDPGVNLRITKGHLIIVADVYDGTNGMIDARGVDGVGSSDPGRRGGDGEPGASVTVMCRRSINAHVSAVGGTGAGGSTGANGTPGVDGYSTPEQQVFVPEEPWNPTSTTGEYVLKPSEIRPGTPGGNGGPGGDGGTGGKGGTITFTSIVDDTEPILDASSGSGGPGAPGGVAGANGVYSEGTPVDGQPGTDGAPGVDGQINYTNVAEADYPAGLRPLLDSTGPSYANYWAPFRIITGDYFYHKYNRSVPERREYARLAAIEFERALELQPDNVDAKRLQEQLVGYPSDEDAVWVGGGNNALGLPHDLDLLPSFNEYNYAFTSFGTLVLDFLNRGVGTIILGGMSYRLSEFVKLQHQEALAARDNCKDDLEIAESEQQLAGDEVDYAQQMLDQATSDIRKALEELQRQNRSPTVGIGDIIGSFAEVAGAVIAVATAVPTGGVSLVALVPHMATLANSLITNSEPIVKAMLAGEIADTKAVKDAYEAVDKDVSAVIGAGRSIVNFITIAQRLSQAQTAADNSKYMALVRRGTELTHQLLLAQSRAAIAQQRVDASQARLTRTEGLVKQAKALERDMKLDADSITRAGMLAIATAQSKADALLSFAFRAQRSVEIYTLKNEEQHLFLDAGLISPDDAQDYYEGDISGPELVQKLEESWAHILKPLEIQMDYTSYFSLQHDQDTIRRSFTSADPQLSDLKTRHQFAFRVDASKIPAGHSDAKIRSVRLALVGASHPAGEVSCEVRHGGIYEQRRSDNTIAIQLLQPRISTRPATTTPLAPDQGLGDDPPLTAPQSLAFWGRGVGGDWQITIPQEQFDSGLDLSTLTEIQVWIRYQFIR
ncbi:hypothetical protein E1264_10660 [Actinomadura sp. KC216]|uniref:hypothetical protein n=1 Tax=Actinomadura sp. KC216 TaxID=2530370 RepID=UPI00104F1A72|nr:hypothetical protein [Actinomadura sp. KC216]TDB88675.1 hypothetical protein E1264_10660 [Actinomadura sp. KC216]